MVILGKIGAPYGIKGFMHVYSHTDPEANLFEHAEWFLQKKLSLQSKTEQQTAKLVDYRPHGDHWVAKLAGIETPEQAKLLANMQIAVPRENLPTLPEGQYYWEDLESLDVFNKATESKVGVVDYLYDNSGLTVMVIKTSQNNQAIDSKSAKDSKDSVVKPEQHIPFVWHDTVLDINLANKTITIDWDFV